MKCGVQLRTKSAICARLLPKVVEGSPSVTVITNSRQERMRLFPSHHKWQSLALGAATRQRDGHNAEFVYCRPKIVSGARATVSIHAVLERANPLQTGRSSNRSLLT